ncbi:MAG: DUF262 domain-containing HNH endonuclease family protein [Paludibacteraceae bacterium]|nr:DUF262 domain-containing HNH endonuclease family protein [Paludibacteraceae bacterium]
MEFSNTTIRGLFSSSIQFTIPTYQRAYSWKIENWRVFLDDIKEQASRANNTSNGNPYSFGNLLLETIEKDCKYDVVDGQQRLTTIVIFMRALYNVLTQKGEGQEKLDELAEDFFQRRNIIKLRPVENDRACFDAVIVNNNSYTISSPSQQCIVEAKVFFETELAKMEINQLRGLKDLTLNSTICRLEMNGKKEAALMFELQNNRGRSLTNMEKLKSYFMYQMYVESNSEETNNNVEIIANFFKDIYKTIYDIKNVSEDSILIYHCFAYLNVAFGYRNIDDIKDEMKKNHNAMDFMFNFSRELSISFANLKKLQSCECYYYKKLCKMSQPLPTFVYPFVIKGYKYYGNDEKKLNQLFRVLETLIFRYHLISSRADINSRLSDVIRNFDGDIDKLRESVQKKMKESWYWSDEKCKEVLSGSMYGNPILHYLLWEYEESIQNRGYKIGSVEIENEQIEHIAPQTEPYEAIEAGYEVNENNLYSDDFREKYLNSIGNLMLISGSHNASIGNKPFSSKLKSYNDNPLLNQQAEIKNFLENGEQEWKTLQIKRRGDNILKFAYQRWNLSTEVK